MLATVVACTSIIAATAVALALIRIEPAADTGGPAVDVDAAIDSAKRQAGAGDYEGALETIRAARAGGDEPDLLFVEAQLLRISGDCETALTRYDAFLATDPPAEDRAEVERYVEACEDEVGPRPEPVVPAPVVSVPEEPPPTTDVPQPVEQPPPPSPRQSSRALGPALWITGGVLFAGGVATYGASWGLRSSGDRGDPTLDTYLERESRARTLSGVGIAVASVGAAVLIAAAVRMAVRRSKGGDHARARVRGEGVLPSVGWLSGHGR